MRTSHGGEALEPSTLEASIETVCTFIPFFLESRISRLVAKLFAIFFQEFRENREKEGLAVLLWEIKLRSKF